MLAVVLLAAASAAEWQKVDISNLPATASLADVAMSADGKYQTAVDFDGYIFRSEDYGVSWDPAQLPPTLSTTDPNLPKPFHKAVAMTSSGKVQVILAQRGNAATIVTLESSDYGKTWDADGAKALNSHIFVADLALISDASVVTAVILTLDGTGTPVDNIVTVHKDGNTLSDGNPTKPDGTAISHPFFKVAMSDTGQYQSATAVQGLVTVEYHGVYYSHDFGASWTKATGTNFDEATTFRAYNIAMSADGAIQTAVGGVGTPGGGFIYRSTNRGQSWTKLEAQTGRFSGVAMSANGVIQTVVDAPSGVQEIGQVRTSGDKGASWSVATVPGTSVATRYEAVAMSRDGAFQTAVASTGIYRYGTPPTPAPTAAPTPKPAPAPAPAPWMSSAAQTATGITLGTVMAVVPIAVASHGK